MLTELADLALIAVVFRLHTVADLTPAGTFLEQASDVHHTPFEYVDPQSLASLCLISLSLSSRYINEAFAKLPLL